MEDAKEKRLSQKGPSITIFAKDGCPYCRKAKALLDEHDLAYEEITIDGMVTVMSLKNVTGQVTVPQIFIDGKRIGGSDKLLDYFRRPHTNDDAGTEKAFDRKGDEVASFSPTH